MNMQETGDLPENVIPHAQSRIVIGSNCSFAYIANCPLCGLEHIHGLYPFDDPSSDPLRAYEDCDGHRASHCEEQGLIGGEWCNANRDPPPECHEPKGGAYQLVMTYPACFTPDGTKNKVARDLMDALASGGVPTSREVLNPRRKFVLRWGAILRRSKPPE